jgi:ABC-type sugar transport system ATPase subunit
MGKETILYMKNIKKSFSGVTALSGVDFFINKGEVHALMGENGAGKSTLIKILTGIYNANDGEMVLEGKPFKPTSALDAQKSGISTTYQELNLIPTQTIYENIYLGREPRKFGRINRQKMMEDATKALKDIGIEVDVTRMIWKCSTAIQQMVAIVRAITIQAKILVMDEPTSSLDTDEVKTLFKVIRKLNEEGIAVIFITHRIDEIFELADKVTILKDGALVGRYDIKEMTHIKLLSLMLGKSANEIIEIGKKKNKMNKKNSGKNVLQANGIRRGIKLHGVDITIQSGEVAGLAGLLGSGRTELARVLFGADIPDNGEIVFMDSPIKLRTPRNAINYGMGLCPEDRKVEGIIPHLTVKENIILANLPRISKYGFISIKAQKKIANEYVKRLAIKAASLDQEIRFLSGGNQQKVVLARWVCMNPKLIILDEPTRGIDVGAKFEIEKLIQEMAEKGIAVLMISSELEVLERNCDRVIIMHQGRNIAELEGDKISEKNILEIIAEEHKKVNNLD